MSEPRSSRGTKALPCLIAAAALAVCPGCFTFTHTVGKGASGGQTVSESQWFALYGLVRLGSTDSQDLADGAVDYTVRTRFTFLDVLITAVTSFVTFYRQTITVER